MVYLWKFEIQSCLWYYYFKTILWVFVWSVQGLSVNTQTESNIFETIKTLHFQNKRPFVWNLHSKLLAQRFCSSSPQADVAKTAGEVRLIAGGNGHFTMKVHHYIFILEVVKHFLLKKENFYSTWMVKKRLCMKVVQP